MTKKVGGNRKGYRYRSTANGPVRAPFSSSTLKLGPKSSRHAFLAELWRSRCVSVSSGTGMGGKRILGGNMDALSDVNSASDEFIKIEDRKNMENGK